MALILNIDTALDISRVSLTEDGQDLVSAFNDRQKDHASWIQVAIRNLMKETGLVMEKLDAVGVNIGPGSYTGVRIGLSTAKGICYALSTPLITETSLRLLAFSAIKYLETSSFRPLLNKILICPMVDARRMEVFTSIYDSNLKELMEAQACILSANSFEELLKRQKILFLGNGSTKFQSVCRNAEAIFEKIPLNPAALSALTYENFIGNNFADLTYTNPLYVKEFFTK